MNGEIRGFGYRLENAMYKRFLLPAAVATTVSGCSLLFVEGPPKPVAGGPLPAGSTCTTSPVFPVVDFIGAVFGSVAVAQADDVSWVVAAAVLGGSALDGVRRVKGCREFLAIPYSDSTTVAPVAAPPNVDPVKGSEREPPVSIYLTGTTSCAGGSGPP